MSDVDPPTASQTPPPGDDGDVEHVEALFDEYLEALEDGADEDIESFASRHPESADALRELWADWSALEGHLGSALPEPLEESFFRVPAGADAQLGSVEVEAGQQLGDFRLVRRLGQGGMGQVWEAEQLSLQRRVALKLIRPGRGGAEAVARFAREAATAGRVEHPGLVTVHAAGEIDGIPFLAQQLVGDGYDLSDYIARLRDAPTVTSGDYRRIAGLFVQVARAVHAAHEAGILHRDLKPQNILIGPDDTPHVTDFGLAHVDGGDDPARPGLVGTWPYMSPEQAAGDDIAIDGRSDVFSLGAVLYEVLALRRAFEGDSGPQVLERVLGHEPPDPRSVRSRVPADLALICMAALSKNRSNRYASMEAFADDLQRFLRNEPILARPPGPLSVAVKWVARHPAWSTAITLSIVALVVITSLLVREVDLRTEAETLKGLADDSAADAMASAALARQRADELEREAYVSDVRAADMHLERGQYAEALARLAATAPARRGWEWHHESLRADSTIMTLRPEEGTPTCLAVGPGVFAAGLPDGSVRTWSADGRAGHHLGGHDDVVRSVAISDDGRVLVSGGDDDLVRRWSLTDGRLLDTWSGHEGRVTTVSVSADGSLAASGSEDRSVRLWSADGQIERVLARLGEGVASVDLSADGSLLAMASRYGVVQVLRTLDGAVDLLVTGHEEGHNKVAMSGDGERLVLGDGDGKLTLWDFKLGLPLAHLQAHAYAVSALVTDHRGHRVLSASADEGSLRLWRTEGLPSEEHAAELQAWDAAQSAWDTAKAEWDARVAAAPAGHADAAGVREPGPAPAPPQAPVISRDDPSVVSLAGHAARLGSVALDAAGRSVLAATEDGRVLVWDGDTDDVDLELVRHDRITSLAADGDGSTLVMGSLYDPVATVRDGTTGAVTALLEGHTLGITGTSLDAAGTRAATVSLDGTLRTWSLPGGVLEQTLSLHDTRFTSVQLFDSGALMLAGGGDGVARVLDAADGRVVRSLPRHRSEVVSVAADRDGRVLAAAYRDGRVRCWHPEGDDDGTWLRAGGDREGGQVVVSGDGSRVAWGSAARDTVRVWDSLTGQPLSSLSGHRTGVTALALSPDGRRVLSASWRDPTLRLWDSETSQVLVLLSGHADTLESALMTRDGGRVLSADRDGSVRVWESRIEAVRALWRARRP